MIEFPIQFSISEKEEFKVFEEELNYLIEFFKDFADLNWNRIISIISEKTYYRLDTTLIESASQTLHSIKLCCSIGSFADANTLIRKLRDDLIQYVFILNIINLRKHFVEEDVKELKTESPENFANSLMKIKFNNVFTDDEKAVISWFANAVYDLPRPIRKKLEFENYMKVLKQNENIAQILKEYKLNEYWETLRKRLNDYVHNNGTRFSAQNITKANEKSLEVHLKNVVIRTSYISSFFMIAVLMIESSLISSTDYIDYLDCGLEPPEDCQYIVAPFIQDFIDKKVAKLHPELKKYLKDYNINKMMIE